MNMYFQASLLQIGRPDCFREKPEKFPDTAYSKYERAGHKYKLSKYEEHI